MDLMTQNLLIIQMLAGHADQLQGLLSERDSRTYRRLLERLLDRLINSQNDAQTAEAVEEIVQLGLNSSAADLFKSILEQVTAKAGRTITRSAPKAGSRGEKSFATREDLAAAGRELAARLRPREMAMAKPPEPARAEEGGRPPSVPPAPVPEPVPEAVPTTEKRISAWIGEREKDPSRPLLAGESYILNFKVGEPVEASLVAGPEASVPASDIPQGGLETEWVVTSSTVKLAAVSVDVAVTSLPVGQSQVWTARFTLNIPREGDSATPQLQITPQTADNPGLEVLIFSRKELYRQFSIRLSVIAKVTEPGEAGADAITVQNEVAHCASGHLNLDTTHEWTTPPGELNISVFSALGQAYVRGDAGTLSVNTMTSWEAQQALIAGPIANVRATAERFRAQWESYLNDIAPEELTQRLKRPNLYSDWGALGDDADVAHQNQWDLVSRSAELRNLAIDGHNLYETFFPPGSDLRQWIDSLYPGHRINISWLPTMGAGWMAHIPWGLMYLPDLPPPGTPVDAFGFLGLRLRLEYQAHAVQAAAKDLGRPDTTRRAYFFYWGNQPQDVTGEEARWQQKLWAAWQNQVFVPTAPDQTAKSELLKLLNEPGPPATTVLYLFCQCAVGDGNDPILRFGNTSDPPDVVRRNELSSRSLVDRPLVFANACTTSAADPYIANELEAGFFRRGCRAYLGTEAKVPIQLASRFAMVFFHFFYRLVDPDPMAAGEAVAQARLFLWTHYRNLGGLFYTYVNQYELFMGDDAEVRALRS